LNPEQEATVREYRMGSEGGSIVLEKVDGKWRAIKILSRWIT